MMGSFEPRNAKYERHGKVYMFDTSSSTPIWISEDSGGMIREVCLNTDDATVGMAASNGPKAGSGWRAAIFMTDSSMPYFVMDETYQGSEITCELSSDGEIAATGGPKDHGSSGTAGGGWIYSIKSNDDIGTDDGTTPGIKMAFTLSQNYPNPARDITTIAFTLVESASANLKVYDISGRLVNKTPESEYNAGSNSMELNISSLPSGIYTYELNSNGNRQVRKMVVVK